jgi:hypothetical protein
MPAGSATAAGGAISMRSLEEIRADIKAEHDAQDASLRQIGARYVHLYEHLRKAHEILWNKDRTDKEYEWAKHIVGLLMHDAETSRLNIEKRRTVLDRLFKESAEWRKAQKKEAQP